MKTIGLIGGMSWESTVTYYQVINEAVKRRLGGLHSARILLYSVDFEEIEKCQSAGEWEKSGEILAGAARALERGGAECVVICTNTMHKVAPQVQAAVGVPLLHIVDATAARLERSGVRRVALLGTRYTMQQDFYQRPLCERGFEVLVPDEEDMERINGIIFDELCLGQVREPSRAVFLQVLEKLRRRGAQGAILGCTEIGLLVRPQDIGLPLFDTALIHAQRAAEWSREE